MTEDSLHQELLTLVSRFCDDAITAEELCRLEELLRADDGLKEQFVDYVNMHTDLNWLVSAHRTLAEEPLIRELSHLLADVVDASASENCMAVSDSGTLVSPPQPPFQRAGLRSLAGSVASNSEAATARTRTIVSSVAWRPILALAASLACIVVLGSWFFLTDKPDLTRVAVGRNDGGDPAARGQDAEDNQGVVGQVTRKVDCVWQDDRWYVNQAPVLKEGQTIRLGKGFMELSLNSGALMVLEGPALLSVESDMRVFLHHGKVSATVPSSARGFTIQTPTSLSVDLGTEFGVKVDAMGNSEVHVFEGEVVAQKLDDEGRATGDRMLFDKGMASRFERSSERSTTAIPISSASFTRLSFQNELTELPHLPVSDNLLLWLSADSLVQKDDKGRVVGWGDVRSGDSQESRSAWQVEEKRRPYWSSDTINGHPTVHFDGHSFLVTDPLRTSDDQTVFVVFQTGPGQPASKPPEGYGYQLLNGNGPPNVVIERQADYKLVSRVYAGYQDGVFASVGQIRSREIVGEGIPYVCAYTYNTSSNRAELRLNNVVQGKQPAPAFAGIQTPFAGVQTPRYIGAHPTETGFFYGDIAEVVIYDGALGTDQLAKMTAYLMAKYEIHSERKNE